MAGHAFSPLQCTKHFYEIDEPSVQALLGKFGMVYFDDSLIYSRTEKEHYKHLKQVMNS